MNTLPKKKHPWALYFVACVYLLLGAKWMTEYKRTGAVEDRKHHFIHYGKDALIVSLAPLVFGAIALGVAIRISIKRTKKQDEPAANLKA